MTGRVFYHKDEMLADEHAARVELLIPEQMDLALFQANCAKADKREVDIFAHGRFPAEDPLLQVILGSWLARHEEAWQDREKRGDPVPVECFGLDVARSLDGDSTVLMAGGQHGIRGWHDWKFADHMHHVREILRIARDIYGIDLTAGRVPICIDYGGGYGAGVGDVLKPMGVWVIEFSPNSPSRVDPRRFRNLRCEAYATLGERLDPNGRWGASEPFAIPPNDRLRRELVAPEKNYSSDAIRFILEPKEEIKQKLQGQSPDIGDTATYLFHAVRELHNLNEWFAKYSGPLTMWPDPTAIPDLRHPREKFLGKEIKPPEKNKNDEHTNGEPEAEPDAPMWMPDDSVPSPSAPDDHGLWIDDGGASRENGNGKDWWQRW